MTTYHYDGSFTGFLTVLAVARENGAKPTAICTGAPYGHDLFNPAQTVASDEERAREFLADMERRISPGACHQAELAFLAAESGRELIIHRYVELGWREGRRIDRLLAHPDVAPVRGLARRVGREAHRFKGLVRFREVTEGFYYGAIEAENRILPLIGEHFSDRFRDQHWLIHDLAHNEAIVHPAGGTTWGIVPLELAAAPTYTPGEEFFTRLWQRYFNHLAIAERHNTPLQRSQLPLKYRTHLVEFQEPPTNEARKVKHIEEACHADDLIESDTDRPKSPSPARGGSGWGWVVKGEEDARLSAIKK
ncbi:MAG TPA: TIGR03915 family putative DNA repair protein, partial [Geobacteraceae bacterium]